MFVLGASLCGSSPFPEVTSFMANGQDFYPVSQPSTLSNCPKSMSLTEACESSSLHQIFPITC